MGFLDRLLAGIQMLLGHTQHQSRGEYTINGVVRILPDPHAGARCSIRVTETTSTFEAGEVLEVILTSAHLLHEMDNLEGETGEFVIQNHGNNVVEVTAVTPMATPALAV